MAPFSSWTSAAITFAPSEIKSSRVPRPMPEAAPVIIATLPSSLPAMSVLLSEKRQSPRVTTTLPMALRLPRWAMASAAFAKGKRSET